MCHKEAVVGIANRSGALGNTVISFGEHIELQSTDVPLLVLLSLSSGAAQAEITVIMSFRRYPNNQISHGLQTNTLVTVSFSTTHFNSRDSWEIIEPFTHTNMTISK